MATAGLIFLRPCVVRPAPAKLDAHARFFAAARLLYLQDATSPLCQPSRRQAFSCGRSPLKASVPMVANASVGSAEAQKLAEESAKVEARIRKLAESDALAYPRIVLANGTDSSANDIQSWKSKFDATTLDNTPGTDLSTLSGRIMRVRRSSSKLAFLDIEANFSRLQVMVSFATVTEQSGVSLEDYKKTLRPLLRGDFISVKGRPMRSDAGELTLQAIELPVLLAPSLAPIPDKLEDDETRVQNRHLDVLVNRQTSDILRFRFRLISELRRFFDGKKFLEVQTPMLADHAGGAIARPFLTSATEFPSKELALRIAPELWLKRMVIGGFDRVYEIGQSFRNEGLDATHNPEFTSCEFYAAYADLPWLIEATEELIGNLAQLSLASVREDLATLEAPEAAYFEKENVKQVEFVPALEEKLQIKLPDLTAPDALNQLQEIISSQTSYVVPEGVSLSKLLDNLAGTYLEPESADCRLYITHHPACMSPLSKSFTCQKTGQLVSARAELFVKGRELANMYEEENDPFEQRRKFEAQVGLRQSGLADADEQNARVDEGYIRALEHGLPPTGGWGCGVDRLVMLFSGAKRISDVLPFGSLRNVLAASSGPR